VPKIISECCDLVKLCHINRSGLVFWRHLCIRLGTLVLMAVPSFGVEKSAAEVTKDIHDVDVHFQSC